MEECGEVIPPHHLRSTEAYIKLLNKGGDVSRGTVLRAEYSDVCSIDIAPVVKARESMAIYSTLSLGLIPL